jgi:hypothetical protein
MTDFTLTPPEPQPAFYDAEICTTDAWPLPAVKEWPEQMPSLWARIVDALSEPFAIGEF